MNKYLLSFLCIAVLCVSISCRKRRDIKTKPVPASTAEQSTTEQSGSLYEPPLRYSQLSPREQAVEDVFQALIRGDSRAPRRALNLGADTISVLTRAIESENINAMIGATKALGELSADEGGELAKKALSHKALVVRVGALDAIAKMKDPTALPLTIKALQDDEMEIRAVACETIATVGTGKPEATQALFTMLDDGEDVVRVACSSAFASVASPEKWMDRVGRLLMTAKTLARLGALRVLGEWHTEAGFDLARGRLSDEDPIVRAEAIAAVAPYGSAAAYREVSTHLNDKVVTVRTEAVAALAQLPAELVRTDVYNALQDRDAGIRVEAASQLVRYSDDMETLIRLHALLRDELVTVREAAAHAIFKLKDRRSFKPVLERLGIEKDEAVRIELYAAMVAANPKKSIPHLIDFMAKAPNSEPGHIVEHLAEITGQKFPMKVEPWRQWYKTQQPAQ